MKKIAVLFLLLFVACDKPEPVLFNHEGVSFSIPGDWKIEDQKAITEDVFYLAAQKQGFSSSGLFTLTWVKGELDLPQNIQTYQDEMRKEKTYQSAELVFSPTKPGKFAGHETLSCDFTATILTVKHHGTIHCFYAQGRTFTILIQEAVDDESDNKEGYEMFEKTLKIKG